MLDKSLTTAAWTTFAKGKPYEDKALLKAHKADKALQTFFKEMGVPPPSCRRPCWPASAPKNARAAPPDDDADPTALTDQLKSLLAVARRGETLYAMLAYTGKQMAVMLSRRPLSASARGVLNKYLGAAGTKYLMGTCVFESNAHTFVLEARVAGLAKRIRQALNEQTSLRLKVRVRGQDPGDVEEADGAEQSGAESEETSDQPAHPAGKAPSDDQARLGIRPSERYGIFKTADLYAHFPELQALAEQWGEKLGRDVNLVGCPVQPERDTTEYLLRTPS